MNKHEEINKKFERIEADAYRGSKDTISLNCLIVDVRNYIRQSESTEKELEGLKRDVKRYIELSKEFIPSCMKDWDERNLLRQTLSKVGEDK